MTITITGTSKAFVIQYVLKDGGVCGSTPDLSAEEAISEARKLIAKEEVWHENRED